MEFQRALFIDPLDPSWVKNFTAIIMIGYFINVFLFCWWVSWLSGLFLVVWWILCASLFIWIRPSEKFQKISKVLYLPAVFILALLEETVVFYLGGGLGGKATSLRHDLLLALPVFVMIGVAIVLLCIFKSPSTGEIFLIGSGIGFIVEFIFGGANFLLMGGGMGLYATMMLALAPLPKDPNHRTTFQMMLFILLGILLCFILGGIIGGTIGDNLYN